MRATNRPRRLLHEEERGRAASWHSRGWPRAHPASGIGTEEAAVPGAHRATTPSTMQKLCNNIENFILTILMPSSLVCMWALKSACRRDVERCPSRATSMQIMQSDCVIQDFLPDTV